MAEARDRDQWDRLAWLLAEIDNAGKSLARCFCEEEIEPTLPDDKSLYVLIAEAEKEEAAGKAKRPRRAPGVAEYDPRRTPGQAGSGDEEIGRRGEGEKRRRGTKHGLIVRHPRGPRLRRVLYLNKSLLSKGLKAVGSEIQAAGDRIKAVGKALAATAGLVTAPILAAAKTWSAAGSEMYRASQRTGMGVEFLSGLKFAANQTGSSFEAMEVSHQEVPKILGELAEGSRRRPTNLHRLGLTTADLAGLSPEQKYAKLAKAVGAVPRPGLADHAGDGRLRPLRHAAAADAGSVRRLDGEGGPQPADHVAGRRQVGREAGDRLHRPAGRGQGLHLGDRFCRGADAQQPGRSPQRQRRAAVDWVKAHRQGVVQATIFAGAALGLGTAIMGAGYAVSFVGGGVLKLQHGLSMGAHYLGLLTRGFGLFPIAGRMASSTLGMITGTASRTWSVLSSLAKVAGSGAMLALRGVGHLGGAGLGLAGRGLSAGAGLAGSALSGAGSLLASGFKAAVPVAGEAMRAIGGAVATGMNVGLRAVGMFVFEFAQGVQGLYRVAAPIPGVLGRIGSAGFSIGRYLSVGLGTAAANAARTAWSASIAGIKVAWFASIAGIKAAWTASVAGVKLAWAAVKAIPSLLSAGYSLAAGLVTTAWTFGRVSWEPPGASWLRFPPCFRRPGAPLPPSWLWPGPARPPSPRPRGRPSQPFLARSPRHGRRPARSPARHGRRPVRWHTPPGFGRLPWPLPARPRRPWPSPNTSARSRPP